MRDYAELLQEDIAAYEGRHDDLIFQAPALYRLLTNILDDPRLPGRLRPLVIAAIAYFILPADIIPEDIYGPEGYLDDIFLVAFVADRLRQILRLDAILEENWEGEAPILPLIADILAQEKDMIGDQRELILRYIGYDYLEK